MNDEDKVIFTVNRHPFGLISLYVTTLLALAASFALILWASNELVSDISNEVRTIIVFTMAAATGLVIIFLLIATKVFWASSLTLTDEEVKQTIQKGLFHKTNSRLGLANVEDVTTTQKGLISTVFKFGDLNIETAGEQANFKFKYCPEPDRCAKAVMDTREAYLNQNPQMQQITR